MSSKTSTSTAADGNDTTNGDEQQQQHKNEIAMMKSMLLDTKVDGGKKSIWTMTIETFSMADGKHKKHDVIVKTLEDGLELLNEYVREREKVYAENKETKEEKNSKKKKKEKLMDLVPLSEFNATQDQFLTSFLKWAEQEEGNDGDKNKSKKNKEETKTTSTVINVSKAKRRLDAYFEWMDDNQDDFEEPLTIESISETAKLWDIQITYDDKGHFLWWIDLAKLDKDEIKKIAPRDHLRYVVWFSHLVMLDPKAQDNGAKIIENMGYLGFWKLATLVPHELGAKMDRLTIGILPVKMKQIYVFGAAKWMTILMTLLKPFMGKKMRDRMVILPNSTDIQTVCDELVSSRKNIPMDFCGIQGEAKRDAVFNKFK